MKDVYSVTTEYKPPNRQDVKQAFKALLRLRFNEVKIHLGGTNMVYALDEHGNKLFGMGGAGRVTIVTRQPNRPVAAPPVPPRKPALPPEALQEATTTARDIKVRKNPLSFKKSGV
ncbi:MAG: hypothetical protein PW788_00475 [Micavibrio sp.]|nr:hypothetical protein [Micavibrio sp.]